MSVPDEERMRQIAREESQMPEAPGTPPIADPTPLGLSAFALALILLSMVNAGWLALAQIGIVVPMALFVGGLGLYLAGIWAFRVANAFVVVAFIGYGTFWFAIGFLFLLQSTLGLTGSQNLNPALGFFLIAWALFTLYIWIASFRVNVALIALTTVLEATFVLLILGFILGAPGLITVGGYTGILDALIGFYIAAAGVIASTFGRTVLPVGAIGG